MRFSLRRLGLPTFTGLVVIAACGGRSVEYLSGTGGTDNTSTMAGGTNAEGATTATGGTSILIGGTSVGAGGTAVGAGGTAVGGSTTVTGGTGGTARAGGATGGTSVDTGGTTGGTTVSTGGTGIGGASFGAGGRGAGGRGLGGRSAVAGNDGRAGGPRAPEEECVTELGEICIDGEPTSGGYQLSVGAPLTFSVRPYGCYPGGCLDSTRAGCQVIGSGQVFSLAGFACDIRNGAACDDACYDGPQNECDTGETLSAGDYAINVVGTGAGTYSTLKFTVPSVVTDDERCSHSLL